MPGSYAHMTMVGKAREKRELIQIDGFPREGIEAAGVYLNFLTLGAVSPDYPYLDLTSLRSKKWADAMHYTHTGDTVVAGCDIVKKLSAGEDKQKCLAWLMGYAAHVVGDMCIHPVVELKVGPYEGYPTEHRKCEMNQDAYIFPTLGLGMPQDAAEFVKATILSCSMIDNPNVLFSGVKNVWEELLRSVHPALFEQDPPILDRWHHTCYSILVKALGTTSRLVPWARHVCDNAGLVYPETDKIDMQYSVGLRVPSPAGTEQRMDYDEIFTFAIGEVRKAWRGVVRHSLGIEDMGEFRGGEWNLDTGRDTAADNKFVFWEA